MSKVTEKDTILHILRPKIRSMLEIVDSKHPLSANMQVNDDILIRITRLTQNGKDYGWGLIFVESDLRGDFMLKDLYRENLVLGKSQAVSKYLGIEKAAEIFAKCVTERVCEK